MNDPTPTEFLEWFAPRYPEVIANIAELADPETPRHAGTNARDDWAWAIEKDGLHYDYRDAHHEWALSIASHFWSRKPRHVISWDDLAARFGTDLGRATQEVLFA